MKTEELSRLLEKYYNGESTEEEERALHSFFNEENVPEGYEAEKVIFSYYNTTEVVPEPSHDFETRILEGIDESERINRSHRFRKYVLPYLSTAAVLFIVIASWFFISQNKEPRDTFTDPELAYAETMKILAGVSYQLNKGERALEPVRKINELTTKSIESINKSTKMVEKNLKNLIYLKKAIEITNIPVEKDINK